MYNWSHKGCIQGEVPTSRETQVVCCLCFRCRGCLSAEYDNESKSWHTQCLHPALYQVRKLTWCLLFVLPAGYTARQQTASPCCLTDVHYCGMRDVLAPSRWDYAVTAGSGPKKVIGSITKQSSALVSGRRGQRRRTDITCSSVPHLCDMWGGIMASASDRPCCPITHDLAKVHCLFSTRSGSAALNVGMEQSTAHRVILMCPSHRLHINHSCLAIPSYSSLKCGSDD
jgi:hypothetical protein